MTDLDAVLDAKVADIRAQRLAARRLLGDLDAQAAMRLTIGMGEVVLTASYAAGLRADVRGALVQRVDALTKALQALGVEE
jgi:hypothetical protein